MELVSGNQYLYQEDKLIVLNVSEDQIVAITEAGKEITLPVEAAKELKLVDSVVKPVKRKVEGTVEAEQALRDKIERIGKALGKAVKRGKDLGRVREALDVPEEAASNEELVEYLTYYGCRYDEKSNCVYLPTGLDDPSDINRWLELANFDTGESNSEDLWDSEPEAEESIVLSEDTVDINESPEAMKRLLEAVADSVIRLEKRYRKRGIPAKLTDVLDGVNYLIHGIEEEFRYSDLAGVVLDVSVIEDFILELGCDVGVPSGVVMFPGWLDITIVTPKTWIEAVVAQAKGEIPLDSENFQNPFDGEEPEEEPSSEDTPPLVEPLVDESEEEVAPKIQLRMYTQEKLKELEEESSADLYTDEEEYATLSELTRRVSELEVKVSEAQDYIVGILGFFSSMPAALQTIVTDTGRE